MQEHHDLKGRLTLLLHDDAGRLVHTQQPRNRIVLSGRSLVARLFAGISGGTPPTQVTHMALGSDATPAADGQTALLAERAPRRAISEVSYLDFDEPDGGGGSTRRVRATLKAVFDFADANDPAVPLREAAIFTDATAGVMYNRVVFEPVTKTNAFKLTLLWDVTF
ncbi:MAG TPA: hypothetical protein PLL72_10525 [Burkholderiaceae bacterium]|nr:hypothetical protein [Burkholderiaceae bacterium]